MTIWKGSFGQGIFLCFIQGIQQIAVAQHGQSNARPRCIYDYSSPITPNAHS